MSWLILVLVWLVISVATATRGFSGGGVECYSVLVLYYFCMYLCDDDICTDADIDEAVASCSLTDDDLELVAESM